MLFASLVLAGSALFGQVSLGVRIGPPPPPRILYQTPAPGPGFIWVDGYWYPVGNRYRWHQGYWTRPPYEGARWIGPHHDGEQFYNGYWDGGRGRFDHDHRWDRDRDHDYRGEFHGDRDRDRR
ncbi:MAG: YXWGXW repeat-containing protein [Acidobacteriota bacterium]|nr:YXWGXW repeat-containing protein [Acidobacteriota bacterium]